MCIGKLTPDSSKLILMWIMINYILLKEKNNKLICLFYSKIIQARQRENKILVLPWNKSIFKVHESGVKLEVNISSCFCKVGNRQKLCWGVFNLFRNIALSYCVYIKISHVISIIVFYKLSYYFLQINVEASLHDVTIRFRSQKKMKKKEMREVEGVVMIE